jgi:hypothetical protein
MSCVVAGFSFAASLPLVGDVPEKRNGIWGVDFSGAQDAGAHIWTCKAAVVADTLRVDSCEPLKAKKLAHCLTSLVENIAMSGQTVVGLDFPFGLPRVLVSDASWQEMVTGFGKRFASADDFRSELTTLGNGRELKRVTDVRAKTPFSPYNLRMYKQTFYGIRDVLMPLMSSGAACVVPMQPLAREKPWVIEICPRSTRKAHRQDYTSTEVVLKWLGEVGVEMSDSLQRVVLADEGGDARDSVIAAFATWRASSSLADEPLPDYEVVEGYVFV